MKRSRQCAGLAALAAMIALWSAPGAALELFGFRLWGSAEEDGALDIIDPLPFTVEFTVESGSDDLAATLQRASSLWSNRETPASGRGGLLAQARGDYRRILAALYANAYYGGEISILVNGAEAAEVTLDTPLEPGTAVSIRVDPGARFRFGVAEIVNAPPLDVRGADRVEDQAADGFRTGARANAAAVAAASTASIERWRQIGHAKAREAEREVIADHSTLRLDARITLDPDRAANFGTVRVEGTRRVDPGFVAYIAQIPSGRSFDPDRIKAAEEKLSRLGVFRSIRIEEAETIAADGSLDLTIRVEDREPRTIGFGGSVSTLDGLGLEAYWQHRNLFGRAERLRFDASVTGLGLSGSGNGTVDYSAGLSFFRPGVIGPNTGFIASLTARQLDVDTYRERSVTGSVGLQRSFARNLNGELSLFATRARFEDFFGTRDFTMIGPVARGDYDRRDDTLDPKRGYFLQAELRPFYEAEFGNVAVRGFVEARGYKGFGADRALVVAARGRIGLYSGPEDSESPPDQLFFAGGAGSVRGYAFRSIGVEATDDDDETGTIGGRGLLEGSGELRYRINERFGAVGFVDAGLVSSSTLFEGGADSDVRAGVGAGVRYFTGLGPLRVDVATPLNPRDDDSAVALYIGIGQAF